MSEKKCRECGAANPMSEQMCDHCGFSLEGADLVAPAEDGEACPECKKRVAPNMRFCDGCGAALGFMVPDADGNPPSGFGPPPPIPDPEPTPMVAAAHAAEPAPAPDPGEETVAVPSLQAAVAVLDAPDPVVEAAPADHPGWKLSCVEGFRLGKEYLLYKEEMLVGRADGDNQIYPELELEDQDDGFVSRRHAMVRLVDGVVSVEDLGGENGTFVNGLPIPAFKQTPLEEGQVLRVGKVGLMLKASARG